jgi:lyso-ornithine lipid O-acyltransferase
VNSWAGSFHSLAMRPLVFFRGVFRSLLLIASLLEARLRFFGIYLGYAGQVPLWRRGAWLHASCARILKRLSIHLTVTGTPQTRGLIVSNHLSYLDVLVFGAVGGCVGGTGRDSGFYIFVSKSNVRHWPLFGGLAQAGGTIFVDRGRGGQVAEAGEQIERALAAGIPVLLFPEGTSSNGGRVLPFRSSLFEPAIRSGCSITPAAIRYRSDESREGEIAYWGEMVFAPHLFRTLCLRQLAAEIRFGEQSAFPDRKAAANRMWEEVSALREGRAPGELPDEPGEVCRQPLAVGFEGRSSSLWE